MASYKENQDMRPHSQQRLSVALTPSNMPTRYSSSRQHSHSVSAGSIKPSHRVTRRKSMNNPAVPNAAAIRVALEGFDEKASGTSQRRSFNHKSFGNDRASFDPERNSNINVTRGLEGDEFAVEEDSPTMDDNAVSGRFETNEAGRAMSKARTRRASEGSHLIKGEGKRSSSELRCEKCGKGYKHSSCLTKHLWEHTPEWSYTSKLLISKHQQVQLLEAASVLVGMNLDLHELERIKPDENDNSSASPTASGDSDPHEDEDYSSAETTPPPTSDHFAVTDGMTSGRIKRHSGNSSSFSRSYQSAPSSSLPGANGFIGMTPMAHHASQRRPSTSGFAPTIFDQEEAGLAAAVESLCSFGTPRNGPVLLPADVPPVPPLPARFIRQSPHHSTADCLAQAGPDPTNPSTNAFANECDVSMGDGLGPYVNDKHDNSFVSHGRGDEDDDGVFGGMEGIAHEAHEELSHA